MPGAVPFPGRSRPATTGFSPVAWQRAATEVTRRAFREVPYYRDQWARAGAAHADPRPTGSAVLPSAASALYPFSRPLDPATDAPPWTGVPQDLLAALRFTVPVRAGVAVLEVRSSWVDWTRLGAAGPRYAAVLASDATGLDAARAAVLDRRARALLAGRADPVVVGPQAGSAEVTRRLRADGRAVVRVGLAEAADSGAPSAPVLVADPHLGYFAAGVPACGGWHVSWRRFHAGVRDGEVVVTALRRRRPTLVCVVPERSAFSSVGRCAVHGTPVLRH